MVAISLPVLEELDNVIIGNNTNNFEVRGVIRFLNMLSADNGDEYWVSIGPKKEKLSLVIKTEDLAWDAITIYGLDKNDHQIINAVLPLPMEHKRARRSSLHKDINLRIEVWAIGLLDYYIKGKVTDLIKISVGYRAFENLYSEIIHNIYVKGLIKG
jgi:predicted ribonuclease YlaK